MSHVHSAKTLRQQLVAAALAGLMPLAPLSSTWAQSSATSSVRLPSLGEGASADLPIASERRLGDTIMREARRDPVYFDDPVLLEYLRSLFDPLVAAARQLGHIDADTDRSFAWEAFLVKDRSVNAFAFPGGYVGMHLGLIAITQTRDQLASVLAHEVTHVTQRHIARRIAPSSRASMLSLATMLLTALAASRSNNPDVFYAGMMGSQGAAIQAQLNFSREMEREADRIGLNLMAAAGFAPAGMSSMFERMDVATRLNDMGGFPYLRSHPLTTERISESRNRVLVDEGKPQRATLLHTLMQQRSRVLMAEGEVALRRLIAESGGSPKRHDRVAALYGASQAASLVNDHANAVRMADEAAALEATLTPSEPGVARVLNLGQVQVRLAANQGAAALALLQRADLAWLPRGRPELLLQTQAQLMVARAQAAAGGAPIPAVRDSVERLQTWVAENPQDATAWEQLAAAAELAGLPLRSMRAAAEARLVLGDLTGAVDRLRAAQLASRGVQGPDFIEASVIDARLRQISAQRRQLQLEARGDPRADRPAPGDAPPPQGQPQ